MAVVPAGSFEQHGSHLPLSSDTLIAGAIADRIAAEYQLMLLPPITLGCSHEHAGFAGTVSLTPSTLRSVVIDIAESLRAAGISRLVIINAHGGNYVLSNVVQERNAVLPRSMALFPHSADWRDARVAASLETDNHDDMHAGEAETSILLAAAPDVVRHSSTDADHLADDRRHLLTIGVAGYAENGVIGRPSLATAEKGERLLGAFVELFKPHLDCLLGA